MTNRRAVILGTAGLINAAWAASAIAQAEFDDPAVHEVIESQQGDPELNPESIQFNPYKVQGLSGGMKASFEPRIEDFSAALLKTAAEFLAVSRQTDKQQVSDFLEAFNLPFQIKGKPLAFCASGISFAAALAYARKQTGKTTLTRQQLIPVLQSTFGDIDHHHFYPTPSVKDMYYVALGKRRWVPRSLATSPKPGWLVIYDWKMNGGADHVGIVESSGGGKLQTIEFNTSARIAGSEINGGAVARKTRPINGTVKGFVRTDIRSLA